MREISPAANMTIKEFLAIMPPEVHEHVSTIRREKATAVRRLPGATLIDKSNLLTRSFRSELLDKVAMFVDENLVGRSEMCIQFALLLNSALQHLGLPSRTAAGTARYFDSHRSEVFRWDHAWVRIGDEVVDGNTDALPENIMVPEGIVVPPYWGPITLTPADRRLDEDKHMTLPDDEDVTVTWWPELQAWIDARGQS